MLTSVNVKAQNDGCFTQELLNKAENGDVKSMLSIADCYLYGNGVCSSLYEYEKWINKAAKTGDAEAQKLAAYSHKVILNEIQSSGYPILDFAQYRAESGDALAMSFMGDYYANLTDTLDFDESLRWLDKAVKLNEPQAMYLKADIGLNIPELGINKKECIDLLEKGVALNHLGCMLYLAKCYEKGMGVDADEQKSFECLMKAAETGMSVGIETVARTYYLKGHDKDNDMLNKAIKWYHKGVEQWSAICMGELAFCYLQGEGVSKDIEKTISLSKKAAACGNELGMHILAFLLDNGMGIKQNSENAEKMFNAHEVAKDGDSERAIELVLEVFPELRVITDQYKDYTDEQSPYAKLIKDFNTFSKE